MTKSIYSPALKRKTAETTKTELKRQATAFGDLVRVEIGLRQLTYALIDSLTVPQNLNNNKKKIGSFIHKLLVGSIRDGN